jgi:hypothetical protein
MKSVYFQVGVSFFLLLTPWPIPPLLILSLLPMKRPVLERSEGRRRERSGEEGWDGKAT